MGVRNFRKLKKFNRIDVGITKRRTQNAHFRREDVDNERLEPADVELPGCGVEIPLDLVEHRDFEPVRSRRFA